MTFLEFDKFFDDLISECRKMRDTKGKEYANGKDRFDNFNRLAAKNDVNRLKVANIYMTKHIDAIDSYVKEGKVFSTENIRGRFVDLIVYAGLMAGMAHETEMQADEKVEITNEVINEEQALAALYLTKAEKEKFKFNELKKESLGETGKQPENLTKEEFQAKYLKKEPASENENGTICRICTMTHKFFLHAGPFPKDCTTPSGRHVWIFPEEKVSSKSA